MSHIHKRQQHMSRFVGNERERNRCENRPNYFHESISQALATVHCFHSMLWKPHSILNNCSKVFNSVEWFSNGEL